MVKAIPIGAVGACAKRLSEYEQNLLVNPRGPGVMPRHVFEWRQLYADCAGPSGFDKFEGLRSWTEASSYNTGDSRDLHIGKQPGDNNRGDYHYRALKLNFENIDSLYGQG